MTRKHYEAIAAAILQTITERSDEMSIGMRADLANNMADAIGEFNPNFKRTRFIRACLGEA